MCGMNETSCSLSQHVLGEFYCKLITVAWKNIKIQSINSESFQRQQLNETPLWFTCASFNNVFIPAAPRCSSPQHCTACASGQRRWWAKSLQFCLFATRRPGWKCEFKPEHRGVKLLLSADLSAACNIVSSPECNFLSVCLRVYELLWSRWLKVRSEWRFPFTSHWWVRQMWRKLCMLKNSKLQIQACSKICRVFLFWVYVISHYFP